MNTEMALITGMVFICSLIAGFTIRTIVNRFSDGKGNVIVASVVDIEEGEE